MSEFHVGQTVKLIRPALSFNGLIMPVDETGTIIPPIFNDGILVVNFARFSTCLYADSTYVRPLFASEVARMASTATLSYMPEHLSRGLAEKQEESA